MAHLRENCSILLFRLFVFDGGGVEDLLVVVEVNCFLLLGDHIMRPRVSNLEIIMSTWGHLNFTAVARLSWF